MKILIPILLLSLALAACSAFQPKDSTESPLGRKIHGHADVSKGEIAPAALFEKLQKGEKLLLLDVRESDEYDEVHIPGTTQRISVKELSQATLDAAGIKKDDQVIVYCRSGARSRVAAKLMRDLGYTNVWELNSGIIHWMEDGLPTESGGTPGTTINNTNAQADSPVIAFDRINHDFGEVKQFGGKVQTAFRVKNEGKSELVIGTITTSCSCTTASLEKTKIPAGSESILTVIFNPNLHEEPKEKFKRTIFLPTNDPQKSEAELTIEVDILEGK
ncbi:DUF1573 domain-containing protein [Candidatus Peregrinibacteria bacterium]|nr:DUF1573 domain-containing protein [Candidatus Peregrinibacteria bacterium]